MTSLSRAFYWRGIALIVPAIVVGDFSKPVSRVLWTTALCAMLVAIALTFELTSCNFPIKNLSHSYSFAAEEGQTTVTQIMRYTPRYGVAGKLMDAVVIRRRSDSGVKKFFDGLKARVEGT